MRVLVVEDEETLATAVAEGLEAEGFSVEVVHNGLEGLALAREPVFSAVVLDILLPGMNVLSKPFILGARGPPARTGPPGLGAPARRAQLR